MEEKIQEQEKVKKGKSKFLTVAAIVIMVVVLFGVFFIGYSFISGGDEEEKITMGPVFESNEFTVNLREAGGRRFLRTKFTVEVDDKKVVSEINTKLPMFNDTVNTVLGYQTLDDLEVIGAKDKIRAQLINELNGILDDGEVTNIYFEVFVWQ